MALMDQESIKELAASQTPLSMQREGSDRQGKPAPSPVDQPAFNYTPSQVATSYAGSMSGAGHRANREDDGHTNASLYSSYTQGTDTDGLVRREGNRGFNTLSDTYGLPTDVNEWDRLDKQHMAITLGLGGLYPAPEVVRAVLSPQDGVTKKILDLGCGTGIWSTEMAREFPHCEVLGIDLAPVPLQPENVPSNCHFEMDDVSLGLGHLQDQFSVVFARIMGIGLKDFRKTLSDVEGCLIPGGIVIWLEPDFDFYAGWPAVYRPFWSSQNPNGSYIIRMVYEIRRISANLLRSDVRTLEKVLDEGFWTHSIGLLDPNTCKTASLYLPIGTWCDAGDDPVQKDRVKYAGMLMRQDVSEVPTTITPLLSKAGWGQQTIDRLGVGVRDECQNGNTMFRVRIAWGRRRGAPGLPAPALPEVTPVSEETKATSKYPLYEIYDTPEQASTAMEIRARGKDIPEAPLPSSGPE